MNFFSKILYWKWWPGNIIRKRSSIYGQVVYTILLLSIFLFVAFGIIFRSVNEKYLQRVINQTGNNIAFLVEGALYHSMLENDKATLQNTLDIIREMPGIDDVSMYNQQDRLVYSSISMEQNDNKIFNPDCKACHDKVSVFFPEKSKAYKIIDKNSNCGQTIKYDEVRHLMIRTPILNEPSCYNNACHVHQEEEMVLGSLIVNMPLENLDSALYETTTDFFILATLMTVLLISFLLYFTQRNIRNPLGAIINASQAVASGDMTQRLPLKRHQLDDMRMVSVAFNNMLNEIHKVNQELQNWSQQLEYKVEKKTDELNEAQNELIKVERMASLGRLSSSVAHELNNPLAGVITYTKLIHKQLNKPQLEPEKKQQMLKYLTIIESETKRCGEIVKGLLDFSRKDQQGFEVKHLHDVLYDTYNLLSNKMRMAGIEFFTDFRAEEDLIHCTPNQVKQACVALLVNASEAVSENGEIIIRTYNPDKENIAFDITDNGMGISAGDIQHIFEPFFSAKDKTSGIGLGLAIVHGIVQNHRGNIYVKSEQGQGTTFTIVFPLTKP